MPEQLYVETYDEPYHGRLFENEYARFYDVRIPPGESSLFHRHSEDTMYVSIGPSRVAEHDLGSKLTNPVDLPGGIGFCRGHRDEPLIHRVTNHGTTEMRMIGVEVKASAASRRAKPLSHPCLRQLWAHPRVRCYRLALEPGESLAQLDTGCAVAAVALTRGCVQFSEADAVAGVQPGDCWWTGVTAHVGLQNVGEERFVAILGEWS